MKAKTPLAAAALALLIALNFSTACAQGVLTPPGPPAPHHEITRPD
ncbi:MAG TPA: hypothetical protein VIK59_07190 [Verrucomicrobiae bacterium]